ncbi:hypothetical protein ACH37Y_19640 [Sphingomonas paucimobilis]|uniref:hypothetical protein n=1 Tax=Sphingomonas paucimobilis TaxID=13689 RepID=UPI0037942613
MSAINVATIRKPDMRHDLRVAENGTVATPSMVTVPDMVGLIASTSRAKLNLGLDSMLKLTDRPETTSPLNGCHLTPPGGMYRPDQLPLSAVNSKVHSFCRRLPVQTPLSLLGSTFWTSANIADEGQDVRASARTADAAIARPEKTMISPKQ